VIEPVTSCPLYTFANLKARCDLTAPVPAPDPDPEWTSGVGAGGEMI